MPLRLRITGLDLFGGRMPRILFAAVAPDPGLSRLRDQVRRAAERAEIDLPRERSRCSTRVWALLRISLLGIQNHMIVNLRGHGYLANICHRVLADNDTRGARTARGVHARDSCSHLRTSKSLDSELHLKLGLCEERAN